MLFWGFTALLENISSSTAVKHSQEHHSVPLRMLPKLTQLSQHKYHVVWTDSKQTFNFILIYYYYSRLKRNNTNAIKRKTTIKLLSWKADDRCGLLRISNESRSKSDNWSLTGQRISVTAKAVVIRVSPGRDLRNLSYCNNKNIWLAQDCRHEVLSSYHLLGININ